MKTFFVTYYCVNIIEGASIYSGSLVNRLVNSCDAQVFISGYRLLFYL